MTVPVTISPEVLFTSAFAAILNELPVNGEVAENTPGRAARALIEMTSGYHVDIAELCTTFYADGYDEMIVVRGISFASLCEHHILPFVGHAHVAYLPNQQVLGLSKIPRIVQAFARRLQIQERMTVQIADALVEHVDPLGVMVKVEAEHSCACHRGVKAAGTVMRTSVTRGAMRDNEATRHEAITLLS